MQQLERFVQYGLASSRRCVIEPKRLERFGVSPTNLHKGMPSLLPAEMAHCTCLRDDVIEREECVSQVEIESVEHRAQTDPSGQVVWE